MGLWPVFLWRYMYEDSPQRFGVGDEICWDVVLVDGEAGGWPAGVLVDTTVCIEGPPPGASHGAVARTPELDACWRGRSPAGSEFGVRAGLEADWFNPPFRSALTGIVRRLQIVAAPMTQDGTRSQPVVTRQEWHLSELRESPLSLRRAEHGMPEVIGLLVGLEVAASEVRGFSAGG